MHIKWKRITKKQTNKKQQQQKNKQLFCRQLGEEYLFTKKQVKNQFVQKENICNFFEMLYLTRG